MISCSLFLSHISNATLGKGLRRGQVRVQQTADWLENRRQWRCHAFEDAADAGSHSDGMARYLEIELIRKQRVKLDAEHSALGKQGSMTLHVGEEVFRCLHAREYHSFSHHGTHLGSTDIECITMFARNGKS